MVFRCDPCHRSIPGTSRYQICPDSQGRTHSIVARSLFFGSGDPTKHRQPARNSTSFPATATRKIRLLPATPGSCGSCSNTISLQKPCSTPTASLRGFHRHRTRSRSRVMSKQQQRSSISPKNPTNKGLPHR